MIQHNIHTSPLTNVNQVSYPGLQRIFLFFTFEDQDYYLIINGDESGVFRPHGLMHNTTNQERFQCPLCQKVGGFCSTLEPHIDVFFKRLIEHPSIRLYWLTIPH